MTSKTRRPAGVLSTGEANFGIVYPRIPIVGCLDSHGSHPAFPPITLMTKGPICLKELERDLGIDSAMRAATGNKPSVDPGIALLPRDCPTPRKRQRR
ncbi:uncharacterized protein LY79DRAFT_153090 [Colletotrichum navitas]|uniref:Uncharacterized protein n=1 Tax=Colletotrichum navitas TaxID=681940 RepID=A0AAD8V7D9_9PEZI|nr:uncharacterized protein LY79DRAFT_153090 [Colletotrichum navitas]KAK1594305.1 hypothetical protein LY79DRAFT_153090 [Colletotrichum navitas]